MAVSRSLAASAIIRSACQTSLRTTAPRPASQRLARIQQHENRALRPAFRPVRWHSAPPQATTYDFGQMKEFSKTPSDKRILIDVREPSEYAAGYIPGAQNLPIKSQPDAIFLPADEFEDKFGFSKPQADQEVVFYCKSGVRSSAAANLARQVGYSNVAEYRGSWLDWEKNGGEASKP
ncbi:Thiosulfate sulfurtransferase rdl2, mitochondrial [Recurvomyces mirabilis]|nr:Thiosulfate sulfurtransferase rdl2, mitochondrial [Recurvomyces mirabilis]